MSSSFLRSAATGILIGAVLVTLVWLIARATGEDLLIQPPEQDEQELALFAPALFTILFGAVATGIAALFRRRGWSPRIFLGMAVAFLVLFGLFAFVGASTTGGAIWLNVMHLAAAAAIVPPLLRGIDRAV